MRRLARLAVTAGSTAVILAATLASAPSASALPDTSDNKIQVIQHNPDMLGPAPAMQAAGEWNGGVDALTFQELCRSQVAELNAVGYHVHWSEQRAATSGTCRKGNAIASVHVFDRTQVFRLITRGSGGQRRTFKLLCTDLRGTGVANTTVCTTHFPLDYNGKAAPTGRQNRIVVANKVRSIINNKIAAGRRVVLSGDFNDHPKSAPLSRLYSTAGSGKLWEGDQSCKDGYGCRTMAATTSGGKRIDYFFSSYPGRDPLGRISKLPVPQYDAEGHYVVRGLVNFAPR